MRTRENRGRQLIAWIAVALIHLLVFWWLAFTQTRPQTQFPPVIELWIGPTGGSPSRAANSGGSEAASPSLVHTPPKVLKTFEDAPAAPPVLATEPPPLVIGTAPIITLVPAAGSGAMGSGVGQGEGAGSGEGAGGGNGAGGSGDGGTGTGPGAGSGPGAGGASWVRELTAAEKRSVYPREGLRRRVDGRVELSCVMRAGNRVSNCRILSERPRGLGFGSAAIETSRLRGVRPPRVNGQPLLNERIRLNVVFDHGVIGPAHSDPGAALRPD